MKPSDLELFPAKVMLFGEYSILLGSPALGIPVNAFHGSLKFIDGSFSEQTNEAVESNKQLCNLASHLKSNFHVFSSFLDPDDFEKDTGNGLFFASNIPQHYGLGSSGALCAAVFSAYRRKVEPDRKRYLSAGEMNELRSSLIKLESFFHGKSSGFDPLVSYLKAPLLLHAGGLPERLESMNLVQQDNGRSIFLIDTAIPCKTGPKVTEFLNNFAPGGDKVREGTEFSNIVASVIDCFLKNQPAQFDRELIHLSTFQLKILTHLIPEAVIPLWEKGLETGWFTLKLCGSGGGGFLLCFTNCKALTEDYLSQQNHHFIKIF